MEDNGANINLRCACLDHLCAEAYWWDSGLKAACDELDWINDQIQHTDKISYLYGHAYEYASHMERTVERLKDHEYRYLETLNLPLDEYARRVYEIKEM